MKRGGYVLPFDEIIRETDEAWYLQMGEKKVWFPTSICIIDEQDREIIVPEWLAIEKGLV